VAEENAIQAAVARVLNVIVVVPLKKPDAIYLHLDNDTAGSPLRSGYASVTRKSQ
jgi:type IV secretory pathway component VirB8